MSVYLDNYIDFMQDPSISRHCDNIVTTLVATYGIVGTLPTLMQGCDDLGIVGRYLNEDANIATMF